MPDEPLVSVCIPSYKHARFLPTAIESVLGQTYPHFEIIIVDDGSADGSVEIAKDFARRYPDKIKVFTHPNGAHRGISETANFAFRESRGKLWCGLASDDAYYPGKLEREVGLFQSNPDLGLVYGLAHIIDENGERLPGSTGCDLSGWRNPVEDLILGNIIPASTVMLRRECLEQAGLHRPGLVYSDWELWIRVAARWQLRFLNEPLAKWRVHRDSTSARVTPEANLQHQVDVLRALQSQQGAADGPFTSPRIRALIGFALVQPTFYLGEREEALALLRAVFDTDPSLLPDLEAFDRWLKGWPIDITSWTLRHLPPAVAHSAGWRGKARFRFTSVENLAGPRLMYPLEQIGRRLRNTIRR